MAIKSRKQVEVTPENHRRLRELKRKYPLSPSIPKLANEALRIGLGPMEDKFVVDAPGKGE